MGALISRRSVIEDGEMNEQTNEAPLRSQWPPLGAALTPCLNLPGASLVSGRGARALHHGARANGPAGRRQETRFLSKLSNSDR
ncbi:hypothetical protein TNCT_382151 [Trichonephila clavata]|uniref:Uncharacterized protein n=1 Tax=Trichonephila clavata TaxID=2740835 RepID=A0A8X6LG91_TRICU|nr:hypothetical protein TNCT_382151 [Trichonephila clavata]